VSPVRVIDRISRVGVVSVRIPLWLELGLFDLNPLLSALAHGFPPPRDRLTTSPLMAKGPTPDIMTLTVRERVLIFCIGSGTDWQRVVPSEVVTDMMVEGFISRDALGRLALTASGRTALRALLPRL